MVRNTRHRLAGAGHTLCALRATGSLHGPAWHPNGRSLCVVGGAGIHVLDFLPASGGSPP